LTQASLPGHGDKLAPPLVLAWSKVLGHGAERGSLRPGYHDYTLLLCRSIGWQSLLHRQKAKRVFRVSTSQAEHVQMLSTQSTCGLRCRTINAARATALSSLTTPVLPRTRTHDIECSSPGPPKLCYHTPPENLGPSRCSRDRYKARGPHSRDQRFESHVYDVVPRIRPRR
jgi:hypothetical protein